MIRRHYFGWFKNDRFYLSLLPPDAPVRPAISLETIDDVRALLLGRKGVEIFWFPPLPDNIDAEIQKGLRLEGR